MITAWSSDQASDSALEYGLTNALGLTSEVDPTLSASHGLTLTGLTPNTTYYFRARSTNAAGGIGYSAILSFKTLDTAAPVISNIVVTPGANHTASMSWTTSKPGTTYIEYGTNTSYGWYSPAVSGTSTPLGWVPSGTVHYRLRSMDSAGNASVTADFTFIEP